MIRGPAFPIHTMRLGVSVFLAHIELRLVHAVHTLSLSNSRFREFTYPRKWFRAFTEVPSRACHPIFSPPSPSIAYIQYFTDGYSLRPACWSRHLPTLSGFHQFELGENTVRFRYDLLSYLFNQPSLLGSPLKTMIAVSTATGQFCR